MACGAELSGLSCGPNISSYDLTNDRLYLRYIVARLASFRNVWWYALADIWMMFATG